MDPPPLRLVSQAKQISPELSALVVYCCATRLRTLCPASAPHQPCQVSSLSERKAKKLIREAGRTWGAWGPVGSWWGRILQLVWKGDGEGFGGSKEAGGPQRGVRVRVPRTCPDLGWACLEGSPGGARLPSAFTGSSAQYWRQTSPGNYDAG